MVPNWQVKEFVGAERESGRVMKVQVIIGNAVWEFLFCYTLFCYQKGGVLWFHGQGCYKWEGVNWGRLVVTCHAGSDLGGFGEVFVEVLGLHK